MWIPECCNDQNNPEIDKKMRNFVKLYYQKLLTKNQTGTQKNSYSPNLILQKKCNIKDRSQAAQDFAINSGIIDADSSKELIFKFFDVTNYQFNEVEWSNGRYKVLSVNKISSAVLDGKRYFATDNQPFISILVGLKKL